MRDDVLLYYERELTYLREMGAQFAGKYPKIAARLMLEESKESEDPHVERLLEAFAFLAGRVHLKLDDDFPENHRGLPRHRLPAFHPARSFHVDRRVPSRPGTRQADHRSENRSRHGALIPVPWAASLQVPHLL